MTQRLTQVSHTHECGDEEKEDENPFVPCHIFEASLLGQQVPSGFQAVRIPLDGKVKSSLDWTKEIEAARRYKEQGLRLFWDMDLGFFSSLDHPLSHQPQFLSLSLSLTHFRDLIWKEFAHETLGLCLYKGTPDFSLVHDDEQKSNLKEWLEEINEGISNPYLHRLFCREAVGEYFSLLAGQLPDPLPLFLFFDIRDVSDPYQAAELISKERYPRFHIGVRGNYQCGGEFGWEENTIGSGYLGTVSLPQKTPSRPSTGICLPEIKKDHLQRKESLQGVVSTLEKASVPFCFIPESWLTTEWDGLDTLFISSIGLNVQTRRKLLGFCAAGGTVVTIGQNLQLPNEISFVEWKKLQNIP